MTTQTTRLFSLRWRRPGRPVLILLSAVAIAAGSLAAAPLLRPAPIAPPRVVVPLPGTPATIGDTTGVGGAIDDRLPLDQRISFWAKRVEAHPDDFLSIVQLALVDAERARLTADLGTYEQALALIDRSIALVPSYPPTIRARASIRFAIHDFVGAETDAKTVLAKTPDDAAALSVLGDAAIELGRPADAKAAYDRLAAIAPGPWLDVRRARLAYATGEPANAVDLARRAQAESAEDDPADAGFYDYALGEFARLSGDGATARTAYVAALGIRPGDLGALVGLAKVDAADGRTVDAVAGLEKAAAIAPQPETLAILGDLQTLAGDDDAARANDATVRLTRKLSELAGNVYDRQLDLFELDHGGATAAILADAQSALAARPDPAGHDVVAWAFHRLGQDAEAAAESDLARRSGIVDARILYHAGAIALARGDVATGQALVQQAIALGPALDPIDRHEAEALLGRS
jgi:tetratricopeptide (TPR) repeat protein